MARIAGVDLPREKRVEIGLTYIFGIGLTTSQTDSFARPVSTRTLASATSRKKRSFVFASTSTAT